MPYTFSLQSLGIPLDKTKNLTNYSFIPQNSVEVLTGCTEVAGKRYASVANAITYINTQTPALNNLWSICSLNQTNAENFTLPDYVGLHSPKGFQGIVQTIFTGNITLGAYSILNSVNCTGQITAGSTDASYPSITFGAFLSGTIVIAAGTYFQPVNTLMSPTSDVELYGQMQVLGMIWLSNNLNVKNGGVLVGYFDMFSGTVVKEVGGTIQANNYGAFYDNTTSGLTSDTVGDAIDEVQGNIPTVPSTTDDLPEGSINKYFSGKTTDNLTQGATNLYDKIVALTAGTGITIAGTYPNFTITNSAPDTELWQLNAGDEIELKTTKDVLIKANYKLFFN